MNTPTDTNNDLWPAMQAALHELRRTIQTRYPKATFRLTAAQDQAEAVHLIATVDIEDPDEVVDLVIDRVLEFQLDLGLPIHVIPRRAHSRVLGL